MESNSVFEFLDLIFSFNFCGLFILFDYVLGGKFQELRNHLGLRKNNLGLRDECECSVMCMVDVDLGCGVREMAF